MPALQREEPNAGPSTKKEPTQEEKCNKAAEKIAEAFRQTPAGKELEARATELGKDFVSSVEGKVIVGTALGGALAAIIATNSELPIPIPEIPLDFISPGLKAKITWDGPVRNPTNVGLTLTTKSGVSVAAGYSQTPASDSKPAEQKGGLTLTIPLGGSPAKKKSGPSDSEKIRAQTAKMEADQAAFREGLKTPAERKQDEEFLNAYWRSKSGSRLNPFLLPGNAPQKQPEDAPLMRKAASNSHAGGIAPPSVHEALARSGQPLDPATRASMESRFGHDFSRVRVHTDALADTSARDVAASAYTVRDHIVFRAGNYAPQSPGGSRLLAHELAHTIQQRGASAPGGGALTVGDPHSSFERQAEHAEHSATAATLHCLPAKTPAAPVATIQRAPAATSPMDDPARFQQVHDALFTPPVAPGTAPATPGAPPPPFDAAAQAKIKKQFEKIIDDMKAKSPGVFLPDLPNNTDKAKADATAVAMDQQIRARFPQIAKPLPQSAFLSQISIITDADVSTDDFLRGLLDELLVHTDVATFQLGKKDPVYVKFLDDVLADKTLRSAVREIGRHKGAFTEETGGVRTVKLNQGISSDAREPLLLHELVHFYAHASYKAWVDTTSDPRFFGEGFTEFLARKAMTADQLTANKSQYQDRVDRIEKDVATRIPEDDIARAYFAGEVWRLEEKSAIAKKTFQEQTKLDPAAKRPDEKKQSRAEAGIIETVSPGERYRFMNLGDEVAGPKAEHIAFFGGIMKQFITNDPTARVRFVGHASSPGTTEFNDKLSRERAKLFYQMARDAGVPEAQLLDARLLPHFGEKQPTAENDDVQGRAFNRRVELFITHVAAGPGPSTPTGSKTTPAASDERTEEPGEVLQRKATDDFAVHGVPPIVHDVIRSPGRPLDAGTRAFFEPRFGHDFSRVRVHDDRRADESARSVHAHAYTLGEHIAFSERARHRGGDENQRELLAHELTHVVQQRNARVPASPAGVDPSSHLESEADAMAARIASGADARVRGETGGSLQRKPAPHITEVKVDQNTPEKVTVTWSDGRQDHNECSSGKGHCCVDDSAGTAAGGACSAARSSQVGNNCTPVGTFRVTARVPKTAAGIEFWTQFHDAKSVALHDYDPRVDGTPLSHGCVRLHREFARLIFGGARVGTTRVIVENLAQPKCNHPALISEWEGDFRDAGKVPPDGSQINPDTRKKFTRDEIKRERHNIHETRTDMRSALGVDDAGLDKEVAAVKGGSPVAAKIPRCVPALTEEEKLTPAAENAGVTGSPARATAKVFRTALNRARNRSASEKLVRATGNDLWSAATAAARAGGAGTDDRPIYWTRLMLSQAIREWNPDFASNADELRRLQTDLLRLLEETSRGRADITFPTTPGTRRILISGFDPFGFMSGGDIRQSNLSGASALALDGATLTDGKVTAHVESVVFPVRFNDFDAGVVESFFKPFLSGPQAVNFIMTISQGGAQFELEEYAGRRRSSGSYKDNLGVTDGGSPTHPVEPTGLAKGDEFIRTNVSSSMLGSMRKPLGRTKAIQDETGVTDIQPGAKSPQTHPKGPPAKPGLAVEGSGGGFLSNEIFYRNSLLRTQLGSTVPVIHLHTPMLAPGAADATRNKLIDTIRTLLTAALPHL